MSMTNDDIIEAAKKFAAHNASQHDGTAQSGSVMGKILAEYPELKQRVKEIMPIINQGIKEVNTWTQEQQQKFIEEKYPELLESRGSEDSSTVGKCGQMAYG